jgi:hypothetical protein
VGASTTPGTYSLTVTGTGTSATHTTGVSLTVSIASSTPPVSGYTAWYDASDATSITLSAGAVSQWNDKSGNGYNLTQSTSARQPSTGTRTLNGRNVLAFNGTSDYLVRNSTPVLTQPNTVFVVAASDTVNAQQVVFDDGGSSGQSGGAVYISNDNKFHIYALGSVEVGNTNANTNPHCFSAVFNGTSSTLFVDGTQSGSSGDAGSQSMTGFSVGDFQDGFGWYWGGVVAEVVVYHSLLSDAQRQSVESYLRAKWGTP